VSYDALYVKRRGPRRRGVARLALCTARKPLTESGAVSRSVLQREADSLEALGSGGMSMATVPTDACALFGPTPQTPEAGEPGAAPGRSGHHGGFYQPVRVVFADDAGNDQYSIGVTRLSCGLGGATQEQAAAFTRRSKPNEKSGARCGRVAARRGAIASRARLRRSAHGEAARVDSAQRALARMSAEPECGDGICSAGEDAQTCDDDCRQRTVVHGSESYVYFDPITRSSSIGVKRCACRGSRAR